MDGPHTHALAEHLAERLCADPVARIDVPEGRWQANMVLLNCVGQVIQRVYSHGKWLFFDFSHGVTWACHLLGKAAWQVRPTDGEGGNASRAGGRGEGGRTPLLTLTLRRGGRAVLTGRPLFLIMPTGDLWGHAELAKIGPDPLRSAEFAEAFAYRLRQVPGRALAAALLDQEIVAGVGNALKCELLFAARLAPGTHVSALLASQIENLAARTKELCVAALEPARRRTAGKYQVYDRAGEACPVCRATIVADHSGCDGHWSWYCPRCQALPNAYSLFA